MRVVHQTQALHTPKPRLARRHEHLQVAVVKSPSRCCPTSSRSAAASSSDNRKRLLPPAISDDWRKIQPLF
ncbi:hypothetical protein ACLK1S_19260 [Escherichia coli]